MSHGTHDFIGPQNHDETQPIIKTKTRRLVRLSDEIRTNKHGEAHISQI